MAKIPGLDELAAQSKQLDDIAGKLDKIAALTEKYRDKVKDAAASVGDLTSRLDAQLAVFDENAKKKIIDPSNIDMIVSLQNQMGKLTKETKKLSDVAELLDKGFDKLGRGLVTLWTGVATKGVELLVSGIQRVYDLQERWTKLTGELNVKMGKLSPSMSAFRKQASQAESTMRGLTNQMGEGTKIAEDFALSYGKMDTKKTGNFALELARGFNLGGDAAGKFSRVLDNLGITQDGITGKKGNHEQAEYFKSLTINADKAGVPLNAMAKDFADNAGFVAKFGKAGQKAFISSAAYLKKFNVTLKDTMAFMDKFDTFDSAADSVAKLNVVFGTNINALNTMLETNPAKRFDQIRTSLLAQGKTWERMTYFEKKALAAATGWSDEVASGLLDAKNSGETYEKFMAKKAKKELEAKDAEVLMHKQLQATATTMFAFGQAADRITVAISNAIKPFTDLLGLTKSGDKDWKSFSQIMETITKKIIAFFNALAKNKQWKDFMQKAADMVKQAAHWVGEFFSPDKLGKNIALIVSAAKKFWDISKLIVELWAAKKVFYGIEDAVKLTKNLSTLAGLAGKGAGGLSKLSGLLGGGGAAGAAAEGGAAALAEGGAGSLLTGLGAGVLLPVSIAAFTAVALADFVKASSEAAKVQWGLGIKKLEKEEADKIKSKADDANAKGLLNRTENVTDPNQLIKGDKEKLIALFASERDKLKPGEGPSDTMKKVGNKLDELGLVSSMKAVAESQDAAAKQNRIAAIYTKQENDALGGSAGLVKTIAEETTTRKKSGALMEAQLSLAALKNTKEWSDTSQTLSKTEGFGDLGAGEQEKRILTWLKNQGTGSSKANADTTMAYLKDAGIKGYASGGLVERPTIATLAEDGPELVVPLPRGMKGVGSIPRADRGVGVNSPTANSGPPAEQIIHAHFYVDGEEVQTRRIKRALQNR